MRKILILVCLVALAVPGIVSAEEELQSLWEIPFGSTIAECQELAMKNAGVALEEDYSDTVGRYLRTVDGAAPKLWGRDVEGYNFYFSETRELNGVRVGFLRGKGDYMKSVEGEEALKKEIGFYKNLLTDIQYEFAAEIDGGRLYASMGDARGEYDYPLGVRG